jgi:hypothetical protein
MRNNKKTMLLLFSVLALALTTSVVSLRGQNESHQSRLKEKKNQEFLNKLPVVNYEAPEPSDPEERARRRAKSKKYNHPGGSAEQNRFFNAETAAKHNDWEWGLESTLPGGQSSAVIVGRVVDAQAYLSEDKANVYSEFTVRVEEILKNDKDEPITVGDAVEVERLGGRVRLPSGRISSLYVTGENPPQVGGRYVFFLGYNRRDTSGTSLTSPRDMNRHILTAYELREGRVSPLDRAGGINFKVHEGKEEIPFLDEVRRSIPSSSPSSPH